MLHDAIHDNLTGLPNRELFFDRLETALYLARSGRTGPAPVMLVIDIDRLASRSTTRTACRSAIPTLLTVARRAVARSQARRHAGAARRRPVRRDHSRRAIAAATSRHRRRPARDARHADQLRRPRGDGDGLVGARRLRRRQPRQGARSVRRRRDRARQRQEGGGDRFEIFSSACARSAPTRQTLESGPAPCAVPQRDLGAVPADRAAGGSDGRRLRGAAPLAPSAARRAEPGGVRCRSPKRAGRWPTSAPSLLEAAARELAAWQQALEVNPPIFATVTICSRQMVEPRPARRDARGAFPPSRRSAARSRSPSRKIS